MARKDDRKKQKKRLKQHKIAATHAKYVAAEAKAERYPEIVYETSEGNGYFVAEVRAVAETLDFDSPEMGPERMREFYRRYRADGFAAARFWLEDLEEQTRQRIVRTGIFPNSLDEYPRRDEFLTHLGERDRVGFPVPGDMRV